MMNKLEATILETIEKYNMLSRGDRVIVALSGGADSVMLFHFLYSAREKLGIELFAAHFDHGLRGEESTRDRDFVQNMTSSLGIPCYFAEGRMLENKCPPKNSIETWARELRYNFLEHLAEEVGAKVATAHTKSDNAETVLFRAIRGTGPAGLGGIPPVRDIFIRPILHITRFEVEEYCKVNKLYYITDSSNADRIYARNRLRKDILPELKKVHPGAENALARIAEDMRDIDSYLEKGALTFLQEAKIQEGIPYCTEGIAPEKNTSLDGLYAVEKIKMAAKPVRLKILALLAGRSANRLALEKMEDVLTGEIKAVQLPDNKYVQIRKIKKTEYLAVATNIHSFESSTFTLPFRTGEFRLPEGRYISIQIYKKEKENTISEKTTEKGLTFFADYDRILKCDAIRTRLAGDVFAPAGRGVTKTIKKWMNEEGIDPLLRDRLPLLTSGNKVYWVWGKGFCDGVQVDENTQQVLVIQTEE